MPQYEFINDLTGETKLLSFGVNDNKQYIDESGYKWRRVFSIPHASTDSLSSVDAFDKKRFTEVTGRKRGNLGDILDYGEELSSKRSEKLGTKDPVKEKYYSSYAAKRGFKHEHPDVKKRKLKELTEKPIELKLCK